MCVMMSEFFFLNFDTKYLRQSTYKEKGLILAVRFRGSGLVWPAVLGL